MKTNNVLMLVFAVLMSMTACKKDKNKTSVTVTVMRYTNFVDRTGPLIPADGATVRYYVMGGGTPLETKTAGTDGKATFENITAGSYRFNAFQTISASSRNGDAEVILAEGDNKSLSITLD